MIRSPGWWAVCFVVAGTWPVAAAPPAVAPFRTANGERLDAAALTKVIDAEILQRLNAENVMPAARADDAEFLRRVSLDITGQIPTYDDAVAFLDDRDPNKRAKLVDRLLADSRYGEQMSEIWIRKLIPTPPKDNTAVRREAPLVEWLKERFNENAPWDKTVVELLTATGSTTSTPVAAYYAQNDTADKLTDSTARLFLGVKLECSQCHDDPQGRPFVRADYWGLAMFFSKLQRPERGRVRTVSEEPAKFKSASPPESFLAVPPKYLFSDVPMLDPAEPYRPALAEWITKSDNPFFARAMANRTWAHYFGRGLVNPVDDAHDGNPPSHPQLLDILAAQFVANGFDVKYLVRAITNSDAYQRTSRPAADDRGRPPILFERMAIKSLSPGQLTNARKLLLGAAAVRSKSGLGTMKIDEDTDATQYNAGIAETLLGLNHPALADGLVGLVRITCSSEKPIEQNVERLWLTVLGRRPTAAETERLSDHVRREGDTAYRQIAWALLNYEEFLLNK